MAHDDPEYLKIQGWNRLGGDAGKAFNDHFKVYWSVKHIRDQPHSIEILINCPQFLRGTLKLSVRNFHVSGSY